MKSYSLFQILALIAGPAALILINLLPYTIISPAIDPVLGVAAWMIIWWISEAVSISITALLPLVLFPLTGIMGGKAVASNYANPIVYLFFGGFVIALALEKVMLHKRIALSILKITGTNANGIILGFMIATALMSMWISNTASTVVMLPIAVSVIGLLSENGVGNVANDKNFPLSIMLGIAFAANIGGMSTLIGTPPNSVMLAFLNEQYQINIGFFQWMKMGVPVSIIMLAITYFFIVKVFYKNNLGRISDSGDIIQNELIKLGPISKSEKLVLAIFLLTASAWMLRGAMNSLFPNLNLSDTTISMTGAVAMFIVPIDLKKGLFPLQWDDTKRLPWGILMLFGGGLALASGLAESGFIDMIGTFVESKADWSIWMITGILILIMLFMTELMSNVALVTILVPLIVGIAVGLDTPILQMVIPVTLASSCAFMLPMATPPNAIVFASGHIKVYQMAKIGLVLNFVSVLILMFVAEFFIPVFF